MNTTTVLPATGSRLSSGQRIRSFVVRFAAQILLMLLVLIVGILNPATISGPNIVNILSNAVPIAILGLGAMWVLVSGGLDLSAGFGVAACALVIGGALQQGLPLSLAILQGLLCGAVLGLINGVLVGVVAMPPFIATLATMAGVQGLVLLLGTQGTVIVDDPTLAQLGGGRFLGIPLLVIVAAGIALVVGLLARYTRFGLYTYGLGSNRPALTARGVPVVRQTIAVYVFGGLLVAATAILLVAKVQIVDTNIANITLLLDAFAATIIGGTSLFGGKGTVSGTLTGALIISLITNSLVVLGVGPGSIDLFKGVVIVGIVVIDAGIRFLERRQHH